VGSIWSRNSKPFWVEAADNIPYTYVGFGQVGVDPGLRSAGTCGSEIWTGTTVNSIEGEWIRFDFWWVQSSPSTADGRIQAWVHRPDQATAVDLDINDTTYCHRSDSDTWADIHLQRFADIKDDWNNPAQTYIYLDDVYLDNTPQRVEIGDNATWANCTHREIQIPSAWSDTSITVTLNQGSFSDFGNQYLYIIDSNGTVSSGYKIEGVTVTATDSEAAEESQATGTFRIARPDTSGNLVVNFTLGGTAGTGDYDEDLSGGTITILDGNTYVDQTITPTDDSDVEGQEILTMTIATDSYAIGSPSQASITIQDNELEEGEVGTVVFGVGGTGQITRDSAGTGNITRRAFTP